MKQLSIWTSLITLVGALLLGVNLVEVSADGDETLGPPVGLTVAPGTGIVAAGVGLSGPVDGTITVDVPAGATVEQVLLYWAGENAIGNIVDDSTITVEGNTVTGDLIGTTSLTSDQASTFRADITGLGLVSAGLNTLDIEDLDFKTKNYGAGVLVIFDDGLSPLSVIDIRDGHDHAYINNPISLALRETDLQTFTFPPAASSRTATLAMFFGDAEPGRPDEIEITIDNVTTTLVNELKGSDDPEWDTILETLTIPAGVTEVTVQAFSRGSPGTPDSFGWMLATLSVGLECQECKGGVTDLTLRNDGPDAIIQVTEGGKNGGVVFDGFVAAGAEFSFTGTGDGNKLGKEIKITVDGSETKIHTSCSRPIGPGLTIGPFTVVSGISRDAGQICPVDDANVCFEGQDKLKAQKLTMKYTGSDCNATSNGQDPGKTSCTDFDTLTNPAHIIASTKADLTDSKNKTWFDSGGVNVAVGDSFDIDAATAGENKLKANTFVQIFDNGNLLQVVEFHTSCSQPLVIGDVFGSLELLEFTPEP